MQVAGYPCITWDLFTGLGLPTQFVGEFIPLI
jgi:hypothetical protein